MLARVGEGVHAKENGKDVIDALALIIPALYPKRNTQSQWFTRFSGAIQEKFPDLKADAKSKLHLPKEVQRLKQTDYNLQVAARNKKQKQLTDTKVLDVIIELQKHTDYISKICLVGVAAGSQRSGVPLTYRNLFATRLWQAYCHTVVSNSEGCSGRD